MKPIVTLTLNPMVDISASVEAIRPLRKIRTSDERCHPGCGIVEPEHKNSSVVHGVEPLAQLLLCGRLPHQCRGNGPASVAACPGGVRAAQARRYR